MQPQLREFPQLVKQTNVFSYTSRQLVKQSLLLRPCVTHLATFEIVWITTTAQNIRHFQPARKLYPSAIWKAKRICSDLWKSSPAVKMAMMTERQNGGLCLVLFTLQFLCWFARGDVYMHNPRGSNNRLNEQNNNRANNNRLFDSQVSVHEIIWVEDLRVIFWMQTVNPDNFSQSIPLINREEKAIFELWGRHSPDICITLKNLNTSSK